MSKSSTVTVRDQPVADVTSVSGALTVHGETITVQTDSRVQVLDLTDRVMALVRCLRIREGIVNLFSMHTTCSVFINEFQTALLADIREFLEHVVARDPSGGTTTRITPTATGSTPTRTCAPSCSATASRSR